ncbi:substrate-binding domain-containing protein [Arthrobacter sp. B0490]|uniref:substrate-binding domain-containing protein n=1 Tax=Arthrobacter sp. B0490 TaxID=2058891 RepID=UPI0015E304CA|nr:substrate-binding domain-containing protein [Arthrobacter sp. B0490]
MPPDPSRPHLDLLSSLVVRKALDDVVIPAFELASGLPVRAEYLPTTLLLEKLAAGAAPDVLIGTRDALRDLEASGVLAGGSAVPLVESAIGLGVARGSDAPPMATGSDLVDTLLGARSVAFSRAGQSGIFFRELLLRLGIAEEVLARATALEAGFTGTALTDGRADVALQQVSELLFVEGIGPVVPLPEEFQQHTGFSVALGPGAGSRTAARRLVDHLTDGPARDAYTATGLQNIST